MEPIAASALNHLWTHTGLPEEALGFAALTGAEPVFRSSFAVGAAAQATIAAAALAACEVGHVRHAARQRVSVDIAHAAQQCGGWFSLDGRVPELWDRFSGLYRCADGAIRLHANFAHHRDGALRLLGLDPQRASRDDAQQALLSWNAVDFETACDAGGLVAAALRTFAQWDATGQGAAVAAQPLMTIERIGEAEPLRLPTLAENARPLTGIRTLDLTRILAGPVGGKALAAYGSDVMLVNSPNLPNIEAIADTSRGKRSAHVDLDSAAGRATMNHLIGDAHVFVQGYRPGSLARRGFGPQEVCQQRPGIVYVSLSAYGTRGPWAFRRGFDSLVQTAMGFNDAEGKASGQDSPQPLPMQILDQAAGYLIAMGASAALCRQQSEGGSWHVQVSLAQTGHWLRGLGRVPDGFQAPPVAREPYLETVPSGFGELRTVRQCAQLSRTPAEWTLPSMPPGSSLPQW
jgi:crotonobetainyl-CoA:carnitine CoA-transferase CaiB-like acyl-CoA transferase